MTLVTKSILPNATIELQIKRRLKTEILGSRPQAKHHIRCSITAHYLMNVFNARRLLLLVDLDLVRVIKNITDNTALDSVALSRRNLQQKLIQVLPS